MTFEEQLNIHWQRKVNKIIEISKEQGYPEQDLEFWVRQPSGVISLIIDIYNSKKFGKPTFITWLDWHTKQGGNIKCKNEIQKAE